jgi:Flp pilus assembly protein TadD
MPAALWYLPSAGLAVLIAIASFLPESRLWGVNHLAFQSSLFRAIALLGIGVSFIAPLRRTVIRSVCVAVDGLRPPPAYRAASVLVPVGAFALFLAFPAATQLLGDGHMIANSIAGAVAEGMPLSTYLKEMDWAHPGAELLNYGAASLAARVFSADPVDGIRILVAAFGALFAWTLVRAVRPGHTPVGPGALVILLALLSGGIQLFFGYVEVYAPAAALGTLYVVGAKRSLSGGSGVWVPAACAVAAVFMHLMAVVLLPSVCFLLLVRSRNGRPWLSVRHALLATMALSGFAVVAAFAFIDMRGILLPPLGRGDVAAAFSPARLLDVLNETLLLFPGFFVIVLSSRRTAPGADTGTPSRDGVESKSNTVFALLVAVPALASLLFVDPKLGMARDWDLFVISGIGLYTLGAVLMSRPGLRHDAAAGIDARWAPLLVMTLVLTSSWVGVNADSQRSAERYESILNYDKTNAAYAYESLAAFHRENGDLQREIRALEEALAASPNPRYLFVLGTRYYPVGETEKALSSLRRALEMRPDYDRARRHLAKMLYYGDRLDELLLVCKQGEELSPDAGFYPYFAGKAYLKRGDADSAVEAFLEARRRDLPPDLAEDADRVLGALGRE